MNDNPMFSVLIANFKNGQFLNEAIESVKNQTYTNFEIVIVDDASTDNSHELYKQYADDNCIKVFYNEINQGCGYTKRKCVELASGELCGFLDPDDALINNALELMVNIHASYPEVSLILSRFYFCDEWLNIESESRLLNIPTENSYLTTRDYQPEHFVSFKKKYYDITDGLSSKYKLGIDQDLIFKLEEVGNIYVLNEFTYKYRIHKKSISSDDRRALYWNLIVRHEACIRRGLNPELYSYNDYIDAFEIYLNEVQTDKFRIESELKRVLDSKAYRLGKFILKPLNFIRNIFQTRNANN